MLLFQKKMEAQAIFLNPFTICSLCKCNFVFSLLIDEETNRSYPFANKLNGPNGVSNLWAWRVSPLHLRCFWKCH